MDGAKNIALIVNKGDKERAIRDQYLQEGRKILKENQETEDSVYDNKSENNRIHKYSYLQRDQSKSEHSIRDFSYSKINEDSKDTSLKSSTTTNTHKASISLTNHQSASLDNKYNEIAYNKLLSDYNQRLSEMAELENESTILQFKVESLQDMVDDLKHRILESNEEKSRQASDMHTLNSKIFSQNNEMSSLSQQILFRDKILSLHGIMLPSPDLDGVGDSSVKNFAELLKESNERLSEKDKRIESLMKELSSLQEQKDHDRELYRESGKTLSDSVKKIQILESELQSYKNSVSSKEFQISKKNELISELEDSENKLREERRNLSVKYRQTLYEKEETQQQLNIHIARLKRSNK